MWHYIAYLILPPRGCLAFKVQVLALAEALTNTENFAIKPPNKGKFCT